MVVAKSPLHSLSEARLLIAAGRKWEFLRGIRKRLTDDTAEKN
jgi:hypothetical protein